MAIFQQTLKILTSRPQSVYSSLHDSPFDRLVWPSALRATGRLRAALSFLEMALRTIVYVDGYNLYYGLLRKSKLKWLDLVVLFNEHVLDDSANVIEVRYYTAPVLGRMSDNPESPQRQRRYLQALRKVHSTGLVIVEGRIMATTPFQRLVNPIPEAPHLDKVQVYDFNEKKTDVNLASDMIAGAWTNAYDQAVLCSNDSDLEGAFATIRRHHPSIRLGLVAPITGDDHRRISKDLSKYADWAKILSPVHIANSQLPDRIPHSALRRPETW
jgi:uncharacterized LabA/DUF88 family protein